MTTGERGLWKHDRARYGRMAWLLQPSWWAVAVYRFGRWTLSAPRTVRPAAHALYFAAFSFVRLATGIEIPRTARIGGGLLIHHFGGIIIHPRAVIGSGCTMRHGVTIGARNKQGPPRIGDDVLLGAYAQVLGPITVGDGARIGALTLVLRDVPKAATVLGVAGHVVVDQSAPEE